jgi:hypothetical protein
MEKTKNFYNPKYKIGTTVYHVDNCGKIIKTKIVKILSYQSENGFEYDYWCDNYGSFKKVGERYFLEKEKAKKSLSRIIKEEIERRDMAIKLLEKEKRKYQKLLKVKS